jgi:diguanylate cyclase (GGDEF)-like protein/PAS domain S-box-containing protein
MALKLIAHSGGVAAALAIGLTAMGYVQAAQGLREQAEATLSSDALVVTTSIDDWNGQRLASLATLARLPAVQQTLSGAMDTTTLRGSIEAMETARDGAETMELIDRNGTVMLSKRSNDIGTDVRARDEVRVPLDEQRPFISRVSLLPGKRPVIYHAVPVVDSAGVLLGVVRARSSLEVIKHVVESAENRTGAGAMGTLLDEQGLVLVAGQRPDWLLRPAVPLGGEVAAQLTAARLWGDAVAPEPLNQADLTEAVGVRGPTVFNWHMDDTELRALARPLIQTPWSYVSALPVSTFDAPARAFLRNAVATAVLGLLLGSASVLLFARSFAAGLRRVTKAAQGLARGDLDQSIHVGSRDELGEMAAAFQDIVSHQRRMATVATSIAAGDLNSEVEPASEQDVLGLAFAGMLRNLRQLVSQVSRSEERFRSLVQNASDIITILEANGTIRYASPATTRVWGHTPEDLQATSWLALVHPQDGDAARRFLAEAIRRPRTNITSEVRLMDAAGVWLECEIVANNLLHQAAVGGIVLTCRDVTERKTFERQLQQMAFHDALTGLPNRPLVTDRLEQALVHSGRSSGKVGVLFIDLDNFKLINDSLGHGAGDELLVSLSRRLQACIRPQDTAARLGGDEFIVLLEQVLRPSDATEVADRIAEALRVPFALGDRNVVVSASIGVAVSAIGDRAESVLRNADLALYEAKAAGKARSALFDSSMERDAVNRLELQADLRTALERDQFHLVYQPIVSLADGRVTEVEALLRWHHPTRGVVSPLEFIPIAEETGLIVPIGQWVLEEACRQARAWQVGHGPGPTPRMSVNLSARQFQRPELFDDIDKVLQETGLDPRCLTVEITETVLMRDAEATIATLQVLKNLGVGVAIDDFGTGYSSLSYLKRFPVDTLKIDQSFVDGLGEDPQDTAIVQNIIALAKTLRLRVTGEGIETPSQRAHLQEMGCDLGQGYLFARPLPAEQLGLMLGADAAEDHPLFELAA